MGVRYSTEMKSACVVLLALCATGAYATCAKDSDCQQGGDMSAYCKTNKDCHCSAPHFSEQGSSCQLACSPDNKQNACCRSDQDCQKDGDKDAYCKTLKGDNPGNGMCRCGTGFSGTTSCKKDASIISFVETNAQEKGKALCKPCISFAEQGLNTLLNEILNVGVIGGCGKLCSGLKTKGTRLACNVACDVVGVKAFIKALNSTDLDPIYFCEKIHSCPFGNPYAKAELVAVEVSPASGPSGTKFMMQLQFKIDNTTGVGEIRIGVDGPTTNPVSQGFVQTGWQDGAFSANVSLDTTSDPFPPQGQPPVMWNPGSYAYTFELCQGECGSKHPGSIVFGKKTGNFTITEN